MDKLYLFTDGSVHVQSKVGYGACLVLDENEMDTENLKQRIQTKRFENTSSTRLELQTLLWALSEIEKNDIKVLVYTDSQNIAQLVDRRARLEENNFCSKGGKLLKNADLYKQFYELFDSLNCKIIKVKGHQPTRVKDHIERIFSLVDKASRSALRSKN
ncbi:RNase H family protein [uncultured Draconibacterium sp.]|uniref:ribonuclease HI n=1 Tax=uncultured Draconibacterium sp. TaxID=1573823 RepID=UPI0029C95D57|nr:RNase H family protein [uncultured Draconibacterium sp.]